jgi:hypothetical protein
VAKVCISSEHCIRIVKGRFGCFKRSNIKFKKSNKEVKELVDIIGVCTVLHNLLINYDEDDIPKEWYDEITIFILNCFTDIIMIRFFPIDGISQDVCKLWY